MKPCDSCGTPIQNHDSHCDACSQVSSQESAGQVRTIAEKGRSPRSEDDDPVLVKFAYFLTRLVVQTLIIVIGVVFTCWMGLGDRMPVSQSTTIGLAIAAVVAIANVLVDWLK